MGRLRVKNFGPLKDVDIELKQYNFFIGPPASGKSTILKLLYSIRKSMLSAALYERYLALLPFLPKIELFNFNEPKTEIERKKEKTDFENIFNQSINQNGLFDFFDKKCSISYQDELLGSLDATPVRVKFESNNNIVHELHKYAISSLYFVPTERHYVLFLKDNVFETEVSTDAFSNLLTIYGRTIAESIKHLKKVYIPIIDTFVGIDQNNRIVIHQNNKKIPFNQSASGWQNIIEILLPLLNKENKWNDIFIEEPELSLFPEYQYALVKELFYLCQDKNICISTHSPYILASVNNLIAASKLQSDIQKRIKKELKLPSDFPFPKINTISAYWLENGTAQPIIDAELDEIKIDTLDTASSIINDDYDKIIYASMKKLKRK